MEVNAFLNFIVACIMAMASVIVFIGLLGILAGIMVLGWAGLKNVGNRLERWMKGRRKPKELHPHDRFETVKGLTETGGTIEITYPGHPSLTLHVIPTPTY